MYELLNAKDIKDYDGLTLDKAEEKLVKFNHYQREIWNSSDCLSPKTTSLVAIGLGAQASNPRRMVQGSPSSANSALLMGAELVVST